MDLQQSLWREESRKCNEVEKKKKIKEKRQVNISFEIKQINIYLKATQKRPKKGKRKRKKILKTE